MDYETLHNSLLDNFKSIFETEIDLINIAKPDFTLPKPKAYVYDYPSPEVYTQDVVFYVMPFGNDFNNSEMLNFADFDFSVVVVFTVKNKANIQKQLYRYAEALLNAIDKNDTLLDLFDFIVPKKFEPFDFFDNTEKSSAIQIDFFAQKIQ